MTSPFRCDTLPLWWGRLRLLSGALSLSGLQWRGVYRRTIPLRAVARVVWHAGVPEGQGANLILTLHDGETLALWVKNAGLWKIALEERAPALLPEEPVEARALDPAA
ncbi:MAG: hypothetical protein KatS3mg042_0181 [Rhodothermaceae bacterium]|nr:MAG: hypothetical protein KatS3mg042_0181 [Rhodothermaceae bacterium]